MEIAAPVARVWAALTDPAMVKQYSFDTELVTDWQLGHRITFRGEFEGRTYEDGGAILAFEPLQRIAHTDWSNFSGLPDTEEDRHHPPGQRPGRRVPQTLFSQLGDGRGEPQATGRGRRVALGGSNTARPSR